MAPGGDKTGSAMASSSWANVAGEGGSWCGGGATEVGVFLEKLSCRPRGGAFSSFAGDAVLGGAEGGGTARGGAVGGDATGDA